MGGSYVSTGTTLLLIVPGLPQTTTITPAYTQTVAMINAHLTRAEALVNAKISKRYDVPVSPAPPLLVAITEDITAYYTYRSCYSQDNHNRLEYFADLRDEAFKELDDIREGMIDLVYTSGSVVAERTDEATNIVDSNTKNYTPAFDVDDALNWKFDDDLIDHISDSRE